jgi:Spy/CpxP family protein refolding chaperone
MRMRCSIARRSLLAAVAVTLTGGSGTAQESPYAGLEARAIKALSAEEIAAYRAGDGMGLALAAELNNLPGPKHVLDLADSLDLSAVQRSTVQAAFDAMLRQAQEIGAAIVAAERELDAAFAGGTLDREGLEARTAWIAELRGRLRFTHLAAHLDLKGVLTEEQTARYRRLRGYASSTGVSHPHDPVHRHPGSSAR